MSSLQRTIRRGILKNKMQRKVKKSRYPPTVPRKVKIQKFSTKENPNESSVLQSSVLKSEVSKIKDTKKKSVFTRVSNYIKGLLKHPFSWQRR